MHYNHINELGNIVKEKITLHPSLPNLPTGHTYVPYITPVEQIIIDKIKEIKSIRDNLISTGGVKVADKWFHSDTHSKLQHLSLVALGSSLPAGIQWKTMDGSFIELNVQLVQQIFAAQVAQENSIFANAEYLISQIKLGNSPDINSGWPETYI